VNEMSKLLYKNFHEILAKNCEQAVLCLPLARISSVHCAKGTPSLRQGAHLSVISSSLRHISMRHAVT
jgi:hypothetical protein